MTLKVDVIRQTSEKHMIGWCWRIWTVLVCPDRCGTDGEGNSFWPS